MSKKSSNKGKNIQSQTDKDVYDISIDKVYYNKKNGHKSSELCVKFKGKDCNIKIVSALRRVCSNNIPTHAFNIANIDIQENTCVAFNNDYMKLRLSQLPIFNLKSDLSFIDSKYWKNINFADTTREKHPSEKNIKIYINSHNNSNEIKPITTKDIKVYIDDEQIEMYDPITPILIVLLRPNDTFKCVMTASLSIGDMHTTYCACSNTWFTYEDEEKDNIFKGELYLKSRGEQTEFAILNHACDYLLKKFTDIKTETEKKVKQKIIETDSNTLIYILDEEDHTIGEILNYELQDLAVFSGLSKPDHNIKSITFKIISEGNKKPADLIAEACDILINKLNIIKSKCQKLN